MGFQVEKDWVTVSGLRAVVIMADMGHRCGYVGVPKAHPLYGAAYGDPHPALASSTPERLKSPELVFDVHGSLTYSGNENGMYPVESDLWWFGYDCSHEGDGKSPEYMRIHKDGYPNSPIMPHDYGVFRSLEYCIDECESLAQQIVEKVQSMTTKNNGGPAFPSCTEAQDNNTLGMTLRDYFAANAMQSMVRLKMLDAIETHQLGVAQQAYRMADAMINERKKP